MLGSSVLDVGAGGCGVVRMLKERGKDARGVELPAVPLGVRFQWPGTLLSLCCCLCVRDANRGQNFSIGRAHSSGRYHVGTHWP